MMLSSGPTPRLRAAREASSKPLGCLPLHLVTYDTSTARRPQQPPPRERPGIASSFALQQQSSSHAPRLTRRPTLTLAVLSARKRQASQRAALCSHHRQPADRPSPTSPSLPLVPVFCGLHVGSQREAPTLGQLWKILAGLSAL